MRSSVSKLVSAESVGARLECSNAGRIGICTGCFDLLHSGHALFFEQCKEVCDTLIVVVGRSKNIAMLKPGRPITPDSNRLFMVAAMESVDFVVPGDHRYLNSKIDCVGICDAVNPDVYIVNDNDSGLTEKADFCKERAIELHAVPRTCPEFLQATSTTEVIEKISTMYTQVNS